MSDHESGVKTKQKKKGKKVNRKRIGVTRINGGKKENFLDLYIDWPIKANGDFEFNSGNDLAPYSSTSEYSQTHNTAWKFALNGADLYLENLGNHRKGVGRVESNKEAPYDVTWVVEQNYFKQSKNR